MLFLWLLLAIHLVSASDGQQQVIQDFVCAPCARPVFGLAIYLPPTALPCLSKGNSIAHLPEFNNSEGFRYCSLPIIESSDVVLDFATRQIIANRQLCLYNGDYDVHYRYQCPDSSEWTDASFTIVHPVFKDKARRRRWLRRRNHKVSSIHFQQDRYTAEVLESMPIKTVVARITATHDKDLPLYYSMLAPDDARSTSAFSIDTTNGEITLAQALDREELARHVLKVTAYERLDSSVSSSTTLIIDVLDVQDNSPIFEKDSYFAEIREDAMMGTTVLSVFAKDADAGEFGQVRYSIENDPHDDLLEINPTSGVISTKKALDREEVSFVRLTVVATDHGIPPRSSQALIELTITDVNDNAPVFDRSFYNITVAEDVLIPSVIATIVAQDADVGENGKVHYSIVTTSTTDLFFIDYDSGELSLRQKPSPKQSPLSLLIRAKDGGQPSHSTTVHCQINIADVNDHAPTFVISGDNGHTIYVEENTPANREVGRLFAVDEDFGPNGEIRYEIVEDDANDEFALDGATGVLTTRVSLDRERRESYRLKIMATDNGDPPLNSTTDLTIFVKDVNDNPPVFKSEVHNLTLSENTPRGTTLLHLEATDADLDQKVTFKIEHATRKIFALINIGDQKAILSLVEEFSPLDRDLRVVISATDQGGLQSKCTVNIAIDDVNTPPSFNDNPIFVKLPENSPVGFHVLKIKASDSDHEHNAKLKFSLVSDHFGIDAESGLITVVKNLDREQQAAYTLEIQVTDSGEPPMSSSTVLDIIIEDVNDNAPEFSEAMYEVSISEDIAVGTSFLQLKAVDPDEGNNGIVNYFLNESDPSVGASHFRLDSTSGLLRVNHPLDRETTETYVLSVVAADRGSPSQKSHTTVTVTLTDVNDNAPQFEQKVYNFWLAENSPTGTIIGSLRATDPDISANGQIEFRIFGGQDAKVFDIEVDEKQKGVVHVLSRTEFDYEAKTNKFTFELQASSGQLSSTVPVIVHISDINDNRPVIRDFVVLIAVYSNEFEDIDVGNIPAFDPDHNATLEHYLEANDVLTIDEFSGKLALQASFKRQINMEQKACVSDGPNTECSRCLITYVAVDEAALRESLTLEIYSINIDQFLDVIVYRRFLDALASTGPRWLPDNIRVFSLQQNDDSVSVGFFISVEENIISLRRVEEIIIENAKNLSILFGYKIAVVNNEMCSDEPCPYFQKCRQLLKYIKTAKRYETENFIMRSLDTIRTFNCECPTGFTTNENITGQCNQRVDLCFNSPCLNNGTCIPLESSYRCECDADHAGPNCEFKVGKSTCTPFNCLNGAECHIVDNKPTCKYCPWPRPDADERCQLRTVSFTGRSFLAIPKIPGRLEWEITLHIATTSLEGVILYTGDARSRDFLELSIEGGLIKVQISLGGKSTATAKLADWPENRISDGQWHKITLKYFDQKIRLSVDNCDDHLSLTMAHRIGYKECAVEETIQLPARCSDLAVSCHRNLDVYGLTYLGGKPASHYREDSAADFTGCIRDFYIDGSFVDFSDFDSFEQFGQVHPGCQKYRPDKCEFDKPCDTGSKCVDQWLGHVCRCHHRSNQRASNCALETSTVSSFFMDESYVTWRLPVNVRLPFSLYFEFKTRERKTQVIALEFGEKSKVFILSIENGHGLARVNEEQFFLHFPMLSNAEWHSVDVQFNLQSVEIVVDTFYKKSLPYANSASTVLQQLYTGLAPSTSYPNEYLGCIRNVELNGIKLKTLETSQTRASCQIQNPCSGNVCPKNSHCVRDWDRPLCTCKTGFVGDHCVDVCSLENICSNEGFCVRSNSSKGYDCVCPEGFGGPNCEQRTQPRQCPPGWFGTYPRCQRCACHARRGFNAQCHRDTGKCVCQPGFFELEDRCEPCECGYGSSSSLCSASTGQCKCSGDASGRRCDRCKMANTVLDRKTLKCVKIKERCPSQIANGVQWPSTRFGVTARQSCPEHQIGIITRKCSSASLWQDVDEYNCTIPALFELNTKIATNFDTYDVGRQLLNITSFAIRLKNRNTDLTVDVFDKMVAAEVQGSLTMVRQRSRHVRDSQFTRSLVEIANILLDFELNDQQISKVLASLFNYGAMLCMIHEKASYVKPFQLVHDNLLFAVDRLDSRRFPSNIFNLPKYDEFAQPTGNTENPFVTPKLLDFYHGHKITLPGFDNFETSTAFYTIIPNNMCKYCEYSIVMIYHLSVEAAPQVETIQISFEKKNADYWKLPECAWLDFPNDMLQRHGLATVHRQSMMETISNVLSSDILHVNKDKSEFTASWRYDQATVVGLNSTHVTCQYRSQSGGIFTVLVTSDNGSLISFANYSRELTFTTSTTVTSTIVLCIAAFISVLMRKNLRLRGIRCTVILAFVFNTFVILAAQQITVNVNFCFIRNSILILATSVLFAWLFVFAFYVYNAYTDNVSTTCTAVGLFIGVVIPLSVSLINFLTVKNCAFGLMTPVVWFALAPIIIFSLLSFYALATSFLISMTKQYSLVTSNSSLKKTLVVHSLLTICSASYNIFVIYGLIAEKQNSSIDFASNLLLIASSVLLLFWANLVTHDKPSNSTEKGSLWMNPILRKVEPDYSAPPEDYVKDRVYDGPPGEWMPDVIPSETYVHHTLQRSLQFSSSMRMATNPCIPQILSPAQKVFAGESHYTDHQTLPREVIGTPSSVNNRIYSATVSRSNSAASRKMSSTHNYSAAIDQDAYFTYSTARYKTSTFK